MKYSLLLTITSLLLLTSCGRTLPENTSEPIPSSPAPTDMSEPLVDGSGALSCLAGLILVTDEKGARCEYDNRPL